MSGALLNSSVEEHRPAAGKSSQDEAGGAEAAVDSDFVVILASLLCALICVLGLIAVARCAWVRRLSSQHEHEQEQAPRERNRNRGLKKKVLRSLPKETYSDEKAGGECAICLAEFRSGEEIRVLPHCSHPFHLHCIDTWLASHSSCPSCRQILPLSAPPRCHMCGGIPLPPPLSSTSTSTAASAAAPEPPPPPPPPQAPEPWSNKDPQQHHLPNAFLP